MPPPPNYLIRAQDANAAAADPEAKAKALRKETEAELAGISDAARRARQYADRALQGIQTVTTGATEERASTVPNFLAGGSVAATPSIGPDGRLTWEPNPVAVNGVNRKGQAVTTNIIDARAPLSRANDTFGVDLRDRPALLASGYLDPSTEKWNLKSVQQDAANIITGRNSTASAKPGAPASTAPIPPLTNPNVISRPNDAQRIAEQYSGVGVIPENIHDISGDTGQTTAGGYYNSAGEYLGPAYTLDGKLIPAPKTATGLRGGKRPGVFKE